MPNFLKLNSSDSFETTNTKLEELKTSSVECMYAFYTFFSSKTNVNFIEIDRSLYKYKEIQNKKITFVAECNTSKRNIPFEKSIDPQTHRHFVSICREDGKLWEMN